VRPLATSYRIVSHKHTQDRIIENTLPPSLSRFLLAQDLDLAPVPLLDLPFYLNAIERLVRLHGSMTSRGE
jgi:hypothetical protein